MTPNQKRSILSFVLLLVLVGCGSGLTTDGGTDSASSSSIFSNALKLNGTSQYVTFTSGHTSTAAHTLEAFVRVDNLAAAANKKIINITYGSTSLYLWVNGSNQFEFQLINSACSIGNPWITATSSITEGQKYHVAWAHDGTWGAIYINGTKELNQSSGGNAGCSASTVHVGWDGSSAYFPGTIDEIRYSNVSRVIGAVQTSTTFPVPSAPYTFDGNTVFLLHLDDLSTNLTTANPTATLTFQGVSSLIPSPFP